MEKNLIPKPLKDWYVGVLAGAVRWLAARGVHPNTLTAVTCAGSLVSGVVVAMGDLRLGGILILVSGTFDILDGAVARAGQRATKFGAFLDSTLDRYAEFFLFFGILYYYAQKPDASVFMFLVVCLALCGSLMVSYVRARAEGLGFECAVGWMQRPERIVLLGFGAAIHENLLTAALMVIAVLANYTAVQRIRHMKRVIGRE